MNFESASSPTPTPFGVNAACLLALALTLLALAGCVTRDKQVLIKTTVFGFQASASPTAGAIPSVQIGLVRSEYLSNPTSTNTINAAPWTSHSTADLTVGHQTAAEDISTVPTRP